MSLTSYSQAPINIKHGDKGFPHKTIPNTHIISGNVLIEHDSAFLRCDSAFIFADSNVLYAFSNVKVTKGDSLQMTGDTVIYDHVNAKVNARGNVFFTDRKMTLNTPELDYDMNNGIGRYSRGALIQSLEDKNTLFSKKGIYFKTSKNIHFGDSVSITNEEYNIASDTLSYNLTSKISNFYGPTWIYSKENNIYCERGFYDSENEISRLGKNSIVSSKSQTIAGDSINYDRNNGLLEVFDNVFMKDTAEHLTANSQYAFYNEFEDSVVLLNEVIINQYESKDTLRLSCDSLFIKNDSIKQQKRILANSNINFVQGSLAGKSNRLILNDADSSMRMYDSPILWSDSTQITGDSIKATTFDGEVTAFNVMGNAFVITQLDSSKYDQIKGKQIIGDLDSNTINWIEVIGNAEAFYHVLNDDSLYLEANLALCAEMLITFKTGEIKDIKLYDAPTASYKSLNEIETKDKRLAGFKWHEGIRPSEKSILLNRKEVVIPKMK